MSTSVPILDTIRSRLPEIEALCRRHHVTYLAVFGSAVTDAFDPQSSDLDFLVEYDRQRWDPFADYFDLLLELQRMFNRKVDLVVRSAQTNPRFIRSFETSKLPLYAA